MIRTLICQFGLITWVAFACHLVQAQPASEQPPAGTQLKVMSFNLRYGSAKDGPNRWELRRQTVVQTIQDSAPDVLGTQETEPFQAEFLQQNLPRFAYVGRSREDREGGEQCGILYSRDRFVLLGSGHWWLSQTPRVPGSKSWDSSLPRMATWVELFDRRSRKAFVVVNTHFDHRGKLARLESARLLAKKISGLDPALPVVLMGDLNTGPTTEPAQALSKILTDTYAQRHGAEGPQGTFGGFQHRTDGARIDYVWVNQKFEVKDAQIVRRQYEGRDPSDHYPVTAQLSWAQE